MENFVQLLNSMQPTHSANAVIKVQLPEQYTDNTVPLNYSHKILHKEKNGENIEIPLQDFEVNPFIIFLGSVSDEGLPLGLKLEYPKALQKTDFKKSDDVIQINNCNNYIKWQRTPEDWYFDKNGNGIIPTQGIQYNHDLDSLTFIAVYKNNKFLYVGALLKMPYTAGDNTDNIQICIPAETLFTPISDKAPIKIDSNNKSWNDVFPLSFMLMLESMGVDENERNGNIIKYDLPNMSSNKDLLYACMRSTTEADGDKYRVDKETFLNDFFQKHYSSYLALIDSGLSPEEATREFVNELHVSADNFPDLTNYDNFVEYISNLLVESQSEDLQRIRLFSGSLQNLFVNSMLYADTTQMCDKSKIHIPNYDSLFSDTYDDYDYENTGTQTPIEEDKSEYTFYPLYYNEIDFTKLEVPYYYQILTGGDYFNLASLEAYRNKHKDEIKETGISFSLLLNWAKEALTFPLSKYDFVNIVTQIFRSSQSPLEDNDTILIQYTDEHEDIQYIDNKFIQGLELFHYKDELTKQADYYLTECELQGSDDLPIPSIGTLPHKKIIGIQPLFEITESIIEELQNASEIENDQILYKSSTSYMDDKEYQFTIDQSKFTQDIKTITFSSNSRIKFDQEVLNVNKRDGCAYELSYSYGTLSNGTQYIKLLFDGYSRYNNRTDNVKLRYVVFRLTDGRIILFMKTKPTDSNYMGTYSFNDIKFTASTSQPTILGPTGLIIYDEPQYIMWTGIKYVPEGVSSVLMTSQDQYILKINDNNILTFNYEDCLERVSEEGAIILTYINEEFQEYLLSIQQLNDSTEASNIPFPENGLCILIINMPDASLSIGLIGSVNKITQNDTVIIERSIRNIIVSNPKIAPYYANEKHGEIFNDYNYNRADGKYSHAEGYYNTIYSNAHYSHIEGNNNIIFGVNSHCEGAKNRSIGDYSHAEGYNTTANGDGVHTEGYNTTASGNTSHAEGNQTTASGDASHAEGTNTTASNYNSHAEGYDTTASGNNSHAEGHETTAMGEASHAEGRSSEKATTIISDLSTQTSVSTIIEAWKKKKFSLAFGSNSSCSGLDCLALANYSHAEGNYTTASGACSHAEGYKTTASGNDSHAEGYETTASGVSSHAEGNYTTASNYASHASGKYNASMTTGGGASNTTGTAFVIGNGTGSSALSNAFSVQYDGTVKAQSTITASTTADYAEFFEWLDGNPDNEDRVGYFVTLDGDKIKIASNEDDYILGVISGEPFVLGNGDCDTWNEMYLHDEFRRTIYEPAPKVKEVLDEEGHPTGEYEVVEGEYEGTRPVLNPKYDPSKVYISRFERKEWSPVGMLGVLAVRHDGTAKVNGYVTVNKDGIATACDKKSEKSYRVIKSKTDNVVEIIFR